ncbi:hypothetical protein SPRG_02603 [Saprolegnia parasitica CBS 223.65]|uniref:Mitochondrial splicing suppressor 51-like C-terminal domain-containing protein n=1 Tax=Saprolegnia parasitica (strain CBS 223.65) TaxID=695850 RepID=A0A067D2C9_SAPPC|nr:hypothetical protein SPRG_02603 [Saprolegnia parasitica CBS 223.65]KDO32911.1 hypothetical protein SPRG_02603 [Saprolegnia parasitica CBS 223.65]|eukprot:XP_012196559.1 hypothetical protein SPRG_02603 [Saprolegnia parasitica CBS 223.65]
MWQQPPTNWDDFGRWAAPVLKEAAPIEERSYAHSRSMTILKALECAKLLSAPGVQHKKHKATTALSPKKKLVLHIVGADQREGTSVHATLKVFEVLLAAFGSADHGYDELVLVLIGPNVEQRLHGTAATSAIPGSDKSVCVVYASELWSEHLAGPTYVSPSAIFCFNAGVWGYDDWLPTFALMMAEEPKTPIVITSYNALEAIDDADCLDDLEMDFVWRWRHEANAFLCLTQRATQHTLPDRVLNENHSWQCIAATHVSH